MRYVETCGCGAVLEIEATGNEIGWADAMVDKFRENHICDDKVFAEADEAAARGYGDCQHDWQHLKGEKCPTCRRCGAARGGGEQDA